MPTGETSLLLKSRQQREVSRNTHSSLSAAHQPSASVSQRPLVWEAWKGSRLHTEWTEGSGGKGQAHGQPRKLSHPGFLE